MVGSQINKNYAITVIQPVCRPEVVSPDGKKVIPLRSRGMLPNLDFGGNDELQFAGSGAVVLSRNSSEISAWNLMTSELILRVNGKFKFLFGDGSDLCNDI